MSNLFGHNTAQQAQLCLQSDCWKRNGFERASKIGIFKFDKPTNNVKLASVLFVNLIWFNFCLLLIPSPWLLVPPRCWLRDLRPLVRPNGLVSRQELILVSTSKSPISLTCPSCQCHTGRRELPTFTNPNKVNAFDKRDKIKGHTQVSRGLGKSRFSY